MPRRWRWLPIFLSPLFMAGIAVPVHALRAQPSSHRDATRKRPSPAGSAGLAGPKDQKRSATPFGLTPDTAVDQFQLSAAAEPTLTKQQITTLLQQKVKYVFVLYQENRSFDSYFGTFPGAEGLFSNPPDATPGFNQPIVNTDGTMATIHPFRIGPNEYASDTDDIDHSHPRIVAKMDVQGGIPQMDQFATVEEKKYSPTGNPSLQAKQFGELAMAYEDGDTIPFLWRYANRFILFDHIFQQMTGPSTPGNLSIIGAQTGLTQVWRHLNEAYVGNGASGPGVPVLNDPAPFWGSPLDPTTTGKIPVNPTAFVGYPAKGYTVGYNLTFATLPLTLAGAALGDITTADRDPMNDLEDVGEDVADIMGSGKPTIPWGWYEEGYDREPTDPASADPTDANGTHASYITHHNGPAYFGYISNNPKENTNLHGLQDFFTALDQSTLPDSGGVFFVKGGYQNIMGLKPANPDPTVQKNFLGDDDHPAYSDAQISEAMVAEAINKIAKSTYWNNCAIILTWDDSEGDYDHVPPPFRAFGPYFEWVSDGPRVPLIVISPFAKAQSVAHEVGDHASVVKLIDTIFSLKPLADLPDENATRQIALAAGLVNQGPFDDQTPGVTDLLSAFDPARLNGDASPLPAWYAQIPEAWIRTLPQQSGIGWRQIGVLPVDYQLGVQNQIPADFNPRPKTLPSM